MTEPVTLEDTRFNRHRETAETAQAIMAKFCEIDGHVTHRATGRRIGWIGSRGYVEVRIVGQRFKAHRVIWLLTHGSWPRREIDHIDGNRSNNTPKNLREASPFHQGANSARKSKKGLPKGVTKRGSTFYARIGISRNEVYLGTFRTPEAAHAAYCAAARQAFGEFFCDGVRS